MEGREKWENGKVEIEQVIKDTGIKEGREEGDHLETALCPQTLNEGSKP